MEVFCLALNCVLQGKLEELVSLVLYWFRCNIKQDWTKECEDMLK